MPCCFRVVMHWRLVVTQCLVECWHDSFSVCCIDVKVSTWNGLKCNKLFLCAIVSLMEENALLRHPFFFFFWCCCCRRHFIWSRVCNFTFFSDCTNLNSFLLCLHKWHFLVECTMDLVETVIGVKALSILCSLERWHFCLFDRSESAVFCVPSSAPL